MEKNPLKILYTKIQLVLNSVSGMTCATNSCSGLHCNNDLEKKSSFTTLSVFLDPQYNNRKTIGIYINRANFNI